MQLEVVQAEAFLPSPRVPFLALVYFGVPALVEITILNFSHAIYAFVTAIQHYAIQQKLTAPAWITKFKWYFVAFNFTAGNIALIITLVVDRIWISGLVPIVCGIQGFVFTPCFIVVVLQLTNRLMEQFTAYVVVRLSAYTRWYVCFVVWISLRFSTTLIITLAWQYTCTVYGSVLAAYKSYLYLYRFVFLSL